MKFWLAIVVALSACVSPSTNHEGREPAAKKRSKKEPAEVAAEEPVIQRPPAINKLDLIGVYFGQGPNGQYALAEMDLKYGPPKLFLQVMDPENPDVFVQYNLNCYYSRCTFRNSDRGAQYYKDDPTNYGSLELAGEYIKIETIAGGATGPFYLKKYTGPFFDFEIGRYEVVKAIRAKMAEVLNEQFRTTGVPCKKDSEVQNVCSGWGPFSITRHCENGIVKSIDFESYTAYVEGGTYTCQGAICEKPDAFIPTTVFILGPPRFFIDQAISMDAIRFESFLSGDPGRGQSQWINSDTQKCEYTMRTGRPNVTQNWTCEMLDAELSAIDGKAESEVGKTKMFEFRTNPISGNLRQRMRLWSLRYKKYQERHPGDTCSQYLNWGKRIRNIYDNIDDLRFKE